MLDQDDTVVNYRVFGEVEWTSAGGKSSVSGGLFYENTDDSFFVMRSGQVGGRAVLERERTETIGGRIQATFRFGVDPTDVP